MAKRRAFARADRPRITQQAFEDWALKYFGMSINLVPSFLHTKEAHEILEALASAYYGGVTTGIMLASSVVLTKETKHGKSD